MTPDAETVGTGRALYIKSAIGVRSVDWVDIAGVGWSRRDGMVVIRLWRDRGATIRFPASADIAAFANERVHAARVLHRHVELPDGRLVGVIAVRSSDTSAIRWRIIADEHNWPADEQHREASAHILAGGWCKRRWSRVAVTARLGTRDE